MSSLVSKLKAPLPFIKGGRASARLCTVWKYSGHCGLTRRCIYRGAGSPLRAQALRVLGVFPALPFFDVAQVPGPKERSLGLGSAGPGLVGRRGVCGVLWEPCLQPPSHLRGRSGLCWGSSTHGAFCFRGRCTISDSDHPGPGPGPVPAGVLQAAQPFAPSS